MFVITRKGFGSRVYLCNYLYVNDGGTFDLEDAHQYKTRVGAQKAADRANERTPKRHHWKVKQVNG